MSPCTSEPRKKIEKILYFLVEINATLERAIEDLENRELNWRPSPKSNTIGNLLKHIVGAEAFWIHHVVGGMETKRVEPLSLRPGSSRSSISARNLQMPKK